MAAQAKQKAPRMQGQVQQGNAQSQPACGQSKAPKTKAPQLKTAGRGDMTIQNSGQSNPHANQPARLFSHAEGKDSKTSREKQR
jgi:hypothetical protein